MENEQENMQTTGEYTSDLSMQDILSFIKLRFRRLLLRALISFVFLILVILLVLAFAPRTSTWSRDILLLLPKNETVSLYPSGKPFSSSDLLSPPVLQEVYAKNNLKDRIDFSDFTASFFMANSDMKKAQLDAEYREKMNKKNISVIDLQNLEREYQQRLQALTTEQLAISIIPRTTLGRTEIVKILNDIPETWYEIYSKLEAKAFPQIDMTLMQQELIKASKQPGRLILLEKTRVYCNQLLEVCGLLNEMLQGKNLSLSSGEFLGDIQQQLRNILQYQIAIFQQYILMNSAEQGTFDRIFIYSKLQSIEHDLFRIGTKYDGAIEAIKALQQLPLPSVKTAESGKDAASPVTLQLDNSFFSQFADMVRNDVNNKLRASYARKTLEYADERAVLLADKEYFQDLLNAVNDKQNKNIVILRPEQFNTLLKEMFTELFAVGGKVIQFRDKILKEYITSRSFYAPTGNVQYHSEFHFSFFRLVLGLCALWVLVNLVWGVCDFCLMNSRGILKKNADRS